MFSNKFMPYKEALKRLLGKHSLNLSQQGQDCWVYGEVFNEKKGGYFLDIGAHDGLNLSNTYILERRYGWTGICIEANPDSYALLKKNRRATCVNACLDCRDGVVEFCKRGMMGGIISQNTDNREPQSCEVVKLKTRTLDALLKEQNAPRVIDYLSMDVEGAEERVFSSLNFSEYSFNCMTIERPTEVLRTTFKENGYVHIKEIPDNDCFFVHQSFMSSYLANLTLFHRKGYFKCSFRWK